MSTASKVTVPNRFHPQAYQFVFEALQFTQKRLHRQNAGGPDDEEAHISGPELLEGIRELALERFGFLTNSVFHEWGVHTTEDFGRMVFELIERGEMRKTERDRLSDFYGVYEFEIAFDRDYKVDVTRAFRK